MFKGAPPEIQRSEGCPSPGISIPFLFLLYLLILDALSCWEAEGFPGWFLLQGSLAFHVHRALGF